MSRKKYTNQLKSIANKTPIVGKSLMAAGRIFHTPQRQIEISATLNVALTKIESLAADTLSLKQNIHAENDQSRTLLEELEKRLTNINGQIADLKHQLKLQNKPAIESITSEKHSNGSSVGSELLADDHSLDEFYIAFENKFRGTEDAIKQRLLEYIPYINGLGLNFKKRPVLDIGCGRGEFLQVMKENGIPAQGIDLNEKMVARAKDQGLNVSQADVISFLEKQKSNSFSVITGFHLAEHIPFQLLIRMVEECYRVLAPGGILILETPNPESIQVSTLSFYYDPSHLNPIPPDLLAFTAESRGFDKVDILRMHPLDENYEKVDQSETVNMLAKRLLGPQDYAIIGHKNKAN